MESHQTAPFGGAELVGQGEGGKLQQGGLEATKVGLQLASLGRQGRIGCLAEAQKRREEKLLSVGLVGDSEGLHESQGFASRKAVTLDGGQTGGLLLVGEGRQSIGKRGAHAALGQAVLGLGRELSTDSQPSLHPIGPSSEQPGHPQGRVVVFLDERQDHPRLVQGRRGPRRSVGCKQQALLLGPRERRLDDDGHELATLLKEALEPLEAVQHLVTTRLSCRRHP